MTEQLNNEGDVSFGEKAKNFLEDNLRLIVSIVFVIAVAVGMYAYSQRTQEISLEENNAQEQTLIQEEESVTEEESEKETPKAADATTNIDGKGQTSSTSIEAIQKKDASIVVSATQGEGRTHLARHAVDTYLQSNPHSDITAAHKVYIEDYLRKHNAYQGRVYTGTQVEFSHSIINDAIAAAQGLSENQLNNLDKYAQRITAR